MLHDCWIFISSFAHRWVVLLTGGLLTLVLFVIERRRGRSISRRSLAIFLAGAAFTACFQVWRDEYRELQVSKQANAALLMRLKSLRKTSQEETATPLRTAISPFAVPVRIVLQVAQQQHPELSPELLCRKLEECPSPEIRKRTMRLADAIDQLSAEFERRVRELSHSAANTGSTEGLNAVLHGWSEVGMMQYRSKYQVYVESYRMEMIRRIGPGSLDSSKNLFYSAAANDHWGTVITVLPEIAGDLRRLAAQLPEP